MGIEKYYPNKLGIQELFEEVDEEPESTLLSAIPLQLLSKILKMNMEGRNCLEDCERWEILDEKLGDVARKGTTRRPRPNKQ